MKNSFSLFEVILTLIVSSIVIIYSTLYLKEIFYVNQTTQQLEIDKINLLSTKIFIDKHKNELNFISYSNNNLYYKNSLLLEGVKEFNINKKEKSFSIKINFKDKIIQTWEFVLWKKLTHFWLQLY